MGFAILLGYFVAINFYTYREFSYDKHASRFKVWRVSERKLLQLALMGGTPAAFYACKKFRHKTKKRSFKIKLYAIAAIQFIFIILIIIN